ncbi:MAG: hypothetical protein V4555_13575, partial [Acidobacteriota bacterium]
VGSLFPLIGAAFPTFRADFIWLIRLDAFYYALFAFTLNFAGYEGEIMRGATDSSGNLDLNKAATAIALSGRDPAKFLTLLEAQRRYYALLFSHEFAVTFWKPGADITFAVPSQTFDRVMPDGSVGTVTRKSFTRRSARPDAWRYHLREMALAEEPLRYIRKYLNVEEDLDEDLAAAEADDHHPTPTAKPKKAARPAKATKSHSKKKTPPTPTKTGRAKPLKRPLPTDLPAFLRRPFPPEEPPEIPRKPTRPRFF